jgi:hypothetical protein
LNSPPPLLSFILPSIPGIVLTGIIFVFTHMCTFPHYLPPPTGTNPPPPHSSRTCSTVLFSNLVEEKRKKPTFWLFWDKGIYTGSYLATFLHICVL